jgi:helicase MOV-10
MTRQISILLHPSDPGRYEDILELVFWHIEKGVTFVITRTVEATIGSREDHELLKAKAPYQRRKFVKFDPVGEIVPSLRPPAWSRPRWVERLPMFKPPPRLIDAAYGPRSAQPNRALANVKKFMPNVFNEKTYGAWFQTLLYIEEERVKSVSIF